MKIGIVGSGAYGIALSCAFLENTSNIAMWGLPSEIEELTKYHTNNKALKGVKVDTRVKFSTSLEEVVESANIVVIAIPIKYVENMVLEMAKYINNSKYIVIATKGINEDNLFAYDIVRKYLHTNKIVVISGGTYAIDMVGKCPMKMTIASFNKESASIIDRYLTSSFVSCEIVDDVRGVLVCGAVKNVYAIISGILEGLNLCESTKCSYFTMYVKEVQELIGIFKGKRATILTYACLSDLLLTTTSYKSRNYTLGVMLGKKVSKGEINNYIETTTIEGLETLKHIKNILDKNDKDFPLITSLYNIIYHSYDVKTILDLLKK